MHTEFVGRLRNLKAALDERGFGLTIELTEDSLVQSDDASLASLDRVRKLDVGLSIDDFGKGYSSLTYLKQIPATEIKIDKRFIGTIALDEKDQHIVQTVIALAHALGMRVVAEGVDSAEASPSSRSSVARWRKAFSSRGRCAAMSFPTGSITTRRPRPAAKFGRPRFGSRRPRRKSASKASRLECRSCGATCAGRTVDGAVARCSRT